MNSHSLISAKTRIAAVIGDPVEHSLSPAMHNAAFRALGVDGVFVALHVASADLGAAITTLCNAGALGASITVPHKTAIIDRCDRLAPSANDIGAVNCIAFEDGDIVGHNTDAGGYRDALLQRFGAHPDGWRPLILGGGGAARAVFCGLKNAGAEQIAIVARDPSRVRWTRAEAWRSDILDELIPAANLIVDCTSASLSAETERLWPAAIDLSKCSPDTVVSTLIYHRDTRLLAEARALGLSAFNGEDMLIHQALGALNIWLNDAPPANVLRAALASRAGSHD